MVPSWELTYPHSKALLKMIFLLPKRDMLVPWRLLEILANWYWPLRNLTPDGIFYRSRGIPPPKKYVNVDVPYATASRNMHTTLLFEETITTPSNLTVNVCELPIKTNGAPPRIQMPKWWMSKCSKSFKKRNTNILIPSFGKQTNLQTKHPKFWNLPIVMNIVILLIWCTCSAQVSLGSDHQHVFRSNRWRLTCRQKRHSPGTYKEAVGSSMWQDGKMTCLMKIVVPSDPSFARIFSDVLPNGNRVFMCISHTGRAVSCIWRRGLFLLTFCALNDTLHDIHTSHMSNASVHTLHMPKPNVTRVQSATEWTASVHTLHMPKPNVTRVQSATEWTASVHTLHMPKPNVTRVQSATEWTASVHTLHMPKPNVTRVQSATEWTASVHTLHMPKPNVTRVQSATEWTASVHPLHMPKPNVTRVQSATEWTASVHTLHMPKPNVTRVQSATEWTASVHALHMPKPNVTRVQSATEWTASVHTLHMPKPNVTRVQSATEWTASVHTLHMPKPNVTRVQSATEWTASVHNLHMPQPNVTRVQSACFGTYFTHAQT